MHGSGAGLVLLPVVTSSAPLQVGPHLHATAALGSQALEAMADELQLETSWAGQAAYQAHLQQQQEQEQEQQVQQGQQQQAEQGQQQQQRKRLWPGRRARAHPGLLQLQADNFACQARGWQAGNQFLLFGPIQSELELTPAFAR
jgi:hypothetical protein